ncbi:Aldo/keto reductase family [Popillia japonica]|uniref:Aldo/keto reductase family n=1 Tax=Popillia japonica TaxID=7064 RepID=A0AAW1MHD8_POPJA
MACNISLVLPTNPKKMPALGYGTWQSKDDSLEIALNEALEAGYRHIDTAASYENEEIIGKVLNECQHPDKIEQSLIASLERLQVDYVDLYLIHYPIAIIKDEADEFAGDPNVDYLDLWKKMEEQYHAGRAKSIGVSNFSVKKITRLLKNSRVKPANNQVEVHVYLQQKELIDFCTKNGITVVAYSPLGSRGYNTFLEKFGQEPKVLPDILSDETIAEIAGKHSKTPAQIALRFLVQLGLAPIPKSTTPERIRENIDIFDFSLDEKDMNKLRALNLGEEGRVCGFDIFGKLTQHPEFGF